MKRSYTFEERQNVLGALEAAKEAPSLSKSPQSELIRIAAGKRHPPSRSTIYHWLQEQLTEEEYKEKLGRRGRHAKLSPEQTQLLVGYVCYCRKCLESVTRKDLLDFVHSYFKVTISKSLITDILHKNGISSQRSLTRESRMTTQKVVDDALDFLREVRSLNYSPDRIIIMDETGLWSNLVKPRTYHFRNGFDRPLFFFPIDFLVLFSRPFPRLPPSPTQELFDLISAVADVVVGTQL